MGIFKRTGWAGEVVGSVDDDGTVKRGTGWGAEVVGSVDDDGTVKKGTGWGAEVVGEAEAPRLRATGAAFLLLFLLANLRSGITARGLYLHWRAEKACGSRRDGRALEFEHADGDPVCVEHDVGPLRVGPFDRNLLGVREVRWRPVSPSRSGER